MKTVVLGIVVSTVKVGKHWHTVVFNEKEDFDYATRTFWGALFNHIGGCIHILRSRGN